MSKIGKAVYSGAADIGRASSILQLGGAFVGALIFGGLGIFLITRKQYYSASVEARVTKANCSMHPIQGGQQFNCSLTVEYEIGGKKYTGSLQYQGNHAVTSGQTISIEYNPKMPTQIRQKQPSTKLMGWIFFLIGVGILGSSILSYFVTKKYKPYAALEGTTEVAQGIKSIF